jgi:hypothetical protein
MTVKVIVELPDKPGKRAELKSLLESIVGNWPIRLRRASNERQSYSLRQ